MQYFIIFDGCYLFYNALQESLQLTTAPVIAELFFKSPLMNNNVLLIYIKLFQQITK